MRLPTLPMALLVVASAVVDRAPAYTPIFDNTHVLSNGLLSIEVMDPVAPDRQDRGVRFSPMAYVIQAEMDDTSYFYAPSNQTEPPWNSNPDRYPAGTPMEFDLGDFDIRPPGFDDTTFGGNLTEFVKIGVGLLDRTVSGNYHQNNAYTLLGATTEVVWNAASAVFTQTLPRESDTGYRYELETTLSLVGNRMRFDYELTNNGTNAFETAQYLHNFTHIGGESPSSASEIEVPWDFTVQGNLNGVLQQDGRKLVYNDGVSRGAKPTIPVDQIGDAPFEMTVRQTNLDEQYVEHVLLPEPTRTTSAEPLGISTWNDSSGVQFSPEVFAKLTVGPGSTIAWSRTFTFGAIPEPTTGVLALALLSLTATARRR